MTRKINKNKWETILANWQWVNAWTNLLKALSGWETWQQQKANRKQGTEPRSYVVKTPTGLLLRRKKMPPRSAADGRKGADVTTVSGFGVRNNASSVRPGFQGRRNTDKVGSYNRGTQRFKVRLFSVRARIYIYVCLCSHTWPCVRNSFVHRCLCNFLTFSC